MHSSCVGTSDATSGTPGLDPWLVDELAAWRAGVPPESTGLWLLGAASPAWRCPLLSGAPLRPFAATLGGARTRALHFLTAQPSAPGTTAVKSLSPRISDPLQRIPGGPWGQRHGQGTVGPLLLRTRDMPCPAPRPQWPQSFFCRGLLGTVDVPSALTLCRGGGGIPGGCGPGGPVVGPIHLPSQVDVGGSRQFRCQSRLSQAQPVSRIFPEPSTLP